MTSDITKRQRTVPTTKANFNWRIPLPPYLLNGTIFDIFNEDTGELHVNCLCQVDKDCFFLYWTNDKQETELFELSDIIDVTCGPYRFKDEKIYLALSELGECPPENRMLALHIIPDPMASPTLLLFSRNVEMSRCWYGPLLALSHSTKARNISSLQQFKKYFQRLHLLKSPNGTISLQRICQVFGYPGKVEKSVLECCLALHLTDGWTDEIPAKNFTFEVFFEFYLNICPRPDIQRLFESITKGSPHMTNKQMLAFLNEHQRDPRLNEILFPFASDNTFQYILDTFEIEEECKKKGVLSIRGFHHYLLSEENHIIYPDKLDVCHDMDQPLAHYFINSSHNTYLTGRQFGGKSSVAMYRLTLLSGCRCVELDCWDGKGDDQEPIVTHGKAMCTDILFKDVVMAIRDTAFVTSPYPVILSFENHCSKAQQYKMAKYCEEILGDFLLKKPLEKYPLECNISLPSPEKLMYKILIKNKRIKSNQERDPVDSRILDDKNVSNDSPDLVQDFSTTPSNSNLPRRTNDASVDSSDEDADSTASCEEFRHIDSTRDSRASDSIMVGHAQPNCSTPSSTQAIPDVCKKENNNNNNSMCESTLTQTPPSHDNGKSCIEEMRQQQNNASKVSTGHVAQTSASLAMNESGTLGENCSIASGSSQSSSAPFSHAYSTVNNGVVPVANVHAVCVASTPFRTTLSIANTKKPGTNEGSCDYSNSSEMVLYQHSGSTHDVHPLLSSFVNYIQPVKFRSFAASEAENFHHRMSSFSETMGLGLMKNQAIDLVNYNKRQLSRIYPRANRVDSSNFMPQIFWNAGCQMVALNFQTLDLAMQLNIGKFEVNGNCGYLLKPEFMRRAERTFDPFSETPIDGVIAASCEVDIISAQFLPDRKCVGTYVEVEMYGLPTDTIRKEFRTRTVATNTLNPQYELALESYLNLSGSSASAGAIGVGTNMGLGNHFPGVVGGSGGPNASPNVTVSTTTYSGGGVGNNGTNSGTGNPYASGGGLASGVTSTILGGAVNSTGSTITSTLTTVTTIGATGNNSGGSTSYSGSSHFVFRKIVLPELACIRFAIYEESGGGKLLAQRVIPFDVLQAGYRYISLRTEANAPMGLATLFVKITLGTYVPKGLAELVDMLADPRAYLSREEKHISQLERLSEDVSLGLAEDGTGANQDSTSATPAAKRKGPGGNQTSGYGSSSPSNLLQQQGGGKGRLGSAMAGGISGLLSGTSASNTAGSDGRSANHSKNQDEFVFESITLVTILEQKRVKSLLAKHQKEVESLRKKQEKEECSLKKGHEITLAKLSTPNQPKNDANYQNNNAIDVETSPECVSSPVTDSRCFSCFFNRLETQADKERTQSELDNMLAKQREQVVNMNIAHQMAQEALKMTHLQQKMELMEKVLSEMQESERKKLKLHQERKRKNVIAQQTEVSIDSQRTIASDANLRSKTERERRVREMKDYNTKRFIEERRALQNSQERMKAQLASRHTDQTTRIVSALQRERDDTRRAFEARIQKLRSSLS